MFSIRNDDSTSVIQDIFSGIFSDNNQTRQQYLSVVGLLYQAGINFALGAGAFVLFVCLRPNNARVYGRRYKALANDERRPPKIGRNPFSWMPILWRTDEQYLLDTVDIDSVLLLRFLKLGTWLMAIFGIIGMCLIVPLNFTNGNNENVTGDLKEFFLLWITLFHITKLSVFWLHAISAYLFTAIFFYFIWREFKYFIKVKQDYFSSPKFLRKLQSRTIMVTWLPESMQSDEALRAYVSSQSTAAVPVQASIARKIGDLQELIDKHEQAVRKIERILHKFLAGGGDVAAKRRPLIKVKGQMVDAINHYTEEIEMLEQTINETRRESESFSPTSVGFVSYETPMQAHAALRSMKSSWSMMTKQSPHPKDIIWSNAQMSRRKRMLRMVNAWLLSIAFCFVAFWPVAALTFIGDPTNIQALWKETIPFFMRNSTLTTIWQTTFSPLVLALYYIAMPHVFRAICRYQGISTHTGVEQSVLRKMYVFYFVSNIVVFTIVGVIVRAVFHKRAATEVISELPSDFIRALNQKAQFWTAYVSLRSLNAMLELAQIISLVMIFFKRYTRHLTPRELRDVTKPPDFDYSPVYSLYLWVFTISMLYSVYSPIVLPFAFLAFILAYWVYKYAVMYVYQTRHDTAGDMWRSVINRMVMSMIIAQVYLIGCLKVRIADFQDRPDEMRSSQAIIYTLIPLPIITLGVGVYLYRWLSPRVNYMNHSIDAESFVMQKSNRAGEATETVGDRFLHPIFSQSLPTPMVDKRVRHLLPRVYRGRISLHGNTMRGKNQQFDMESKPFAGSIADASTVFGSEMMDTESVMDEQDRRDFDGAATPIPFQNPRKVGAVNAMTDRGPSRLARSFSVDSNQTTNSGDAMEMQAMGSTLQPHKVHAAGSRANLLSNAQPLGSSSAHSPEYLDYDGNATVVGRSASGSPEDGNMDRNRFVRDTFDPIGLYGDIESRGSSRADSRAHLMQPSGGAYNTDTSNSYVGPGPWYSNNMVSTEPVPPLPQPDDQPARYATAPRPTNTQTNMGQNIHRQQQQPPHMRSDMSMGAFGSQAPPPNHNPNARNVPKWD
ncbi:hypothetical protein LPJ68_003747 [Coemansia sp. RSA 1086]|nr:hypothetical protein LPJ68_003747 [Coemansia sp. RSA 1086]